MTAPARFTTPRRTWPRVSEVQLASTWPGQELRWGIPKSSWLFQYKVMVIHDLGDLGHTPPKKRKPPKKCVTSVCFFCFCVFGSRLCRNVEGKWSECSSAHSFGAHRKIHSVESSSGKSPSRRLGYVACHCALYPWQLEVRGICHGSASRMTPTLVPNWNAFIADYHQNDPSQLISPLVNVGWSYSTNCYHGGKKHYQRLLIVHWNCDMCHFRVLQGWFFGVCPARLASYSCKVAGSPK
jgi:hypothetical protein